MPLKSGVTAPELSTLGERELRERVLSRPLPRHVAIIMDGNGRWATSRGLPRVAGHGEGVKSVRSVVRAAGEVGIEYLTLYAFSSENWNRPSHEVSTLMRLLKEYLNKELENIHKNNIRFRTIGRTEELDSSVRSELEKASARTRNNTGMTLCLANHDFSSAAASANSGFRSG